MRANASTLLRSSAIGLAKQLLIIFVFSILMFSLGGCTTVEDTITKLGRTIIGTITLIGSVSAGVAIGIVGILFIATSVTGQSSSAPRLIIGFALIFVGVATVVLGPGLIYDTMVSLAQDAPPVNFYKP